MTDLCQAPAQEEKEDPHEYVTLCRPRHDILAEKRAGSDDEEEDGDDDEDDEEDENRCGGGGCMCNKVSIIFLTGVPGRYMPSAAKRSLSKRA